MATSIKIDDELKGRVQHLANLRQRSLHWIMREAIAQYVEREEARESFKQDPDGVMDAHGLTAEDKSVLRSGDSDKIRKYLGGDAPTGCCIIVFI